MANQFTEQEEIKCAFCGKTQDQVKKMIAGNGVYICNECVDLAKKLLTMNYEQILLRQLVNYLNQLKLRSNLINM